MQAKQYAQALYNLLRAKAALEHAALLGNFVGVLRAKGHVRLLPNILKEFMRISERMERRDRAVCAVARIVDAEKYTAEISQAASELGTSMAELKIKEDGNIIGGFRLEKGGLVADRSYKSMLLELYHKIVAA